MDAHEARPSSAGPYTAAGLGDDQARSGYTIESPRTFTSDGRCLVRQSGTVRSGDGRV